MSQAGQFKKFLIRNTGRAPFGKVSRVVTVFGGSGFVGRYAVQHLVRTGAFVLTPHRRDPHDMRHLIVMGDVGLCHLFFPTLPGQVHPFPFHARDAASIDRAVQESDAVINLCALDYETKNFSYEEANIELARSIAEAVKRRGNLTRLIHLSHLGANFQSPSRLLTAKAWGEKVVRELVPTATIFRPGPVFGAEDRLLCRFGRSARVLNRIPLVRPERLIQPVCVSDLARGIAYAAGSNGDQLEGKTVVAGGPEITTDGDLAKLVMEHLYLKPRAKRGNRLLMNLFARMGEILPRPLLVTDQLRQMALDCVEPDAVPSNVVRLSSLPGCEDMLTIDSMCESIVRRYRTGSVEDDPPPVGVTLKCMKAPN